MFRFLSTLCILFCAAFILLNVSARAIGSTQPPPAALLGFHEGCTNQPQPCWQGIVPGVTPITEAEKRLFQMGFVVDVAQPNIYFHTENNCVIEMTRDTAAVKRITLDLGCSALQLGDIMAQFGAPEGVGAWRLFFGAGRIQATVGNRPEWVAQNRCMDFSPRSKAVALVLQNPHMVASDSAPMRWRGALAYVFYVKRYEAWTCRALMNAPF